ncbi:MAG: hypothetical protein GX951_01585 [Mollicutes bacterium]|nr:hypothetical protein [Mollicutes bacterium]
MKHFHRKLSSHDLKERITWSIILFVIIFFSTTIISYFILPEGIFKNKNPLQLWNTSNNIFILTLQIFFYNLLSVIIIIFSSLFGSKKKNEENYISVGYTVFYTLILINAIVLGTWSFSIVVNTVPLLKRVIGIFDIIHRAALWEMFGQLLITCAIAHISIIRICGKDTEKRGIKEIRLTKHEKIVFILGVIFMLVGAIIESIAISRLG